MVQRAERLPVRITAQIVERSVVLLLRRTLGGMMERRRKVRWLKVGLQRLMVHRRCRSVCTAASATATTATAATAVTSSCTTSRVSSYVSAIAPAACTSITSSAAASSSAATATATVATAMRCVRRTAARQSDATVAGETFLMQRFKTIPNIERNTVRSEI